MKLTLPALALIIANATPLIGVIFFGWDLLQIMILYWLESGVIGFYNIIKMLLTNPVAGVVFVPFFIVHYGGFMLGHLIFILALFGSHHFLDQKFILSDAWRQTIPVIMAPLISLFISHGISFWKNFVGRREQKNIAMQMFSPYGRIMLMHITLILGGMISFFLGAPAAALALLVIIKTAVDLFTHIREHIPKPRLV